MYDTPWIPGWSDTQLYHSPWGGRNPAPVAPVGAVPPGSPMNPSPQQGSGPFGAVPGPISLPDPHADLSKIIPGLDSLNQGASSSILAKLRGQLSPETQRMLQDKAAAWGLGAGMPLSGITHARTARDLGRASEDLQAQGIQEYGSFIPTVAHTQTVSPETQIGVAEQNALNAAAPNPAQAAAYAEQLFNRYLQSIGHGGRGQQQYRGPQGGTGQFTQPQPPPAQSGRGGWNPTPTTPPVQPGQGTADTGWPSWFDPTLSDQAQFEQMFPNEPWQTQLPEGVGVGMENLIGNGVFPGDIYNVDTNPWENYA